MLSALVLAAQLAAAPPPTDAFRLGAGAALDAGLYTHAAAIGGSLVLTGAGRVDVFGYRVDLDAAGYASTVGPIVRPALSGAFGFMADVEDARVLLGVGPVVGIGIYPEAPAAEQLLLDIGPQAVAAVSVPLSEALVLDVAVRTALPFALPLGAMTFLPSLALELQWAP